MFLVLAGSTAAAATGALDGPAPGQNSVGSLDIIDRQVQNPDIQDSSIRGGKVRDNSLSGADVVDGGLTGTDVENGSLTGADLADGSVGGADVDESTLQPVPEAVLGGMGSGSNQTSPPCDPESTAFISCASATTDLPQTTRVLVMGTAKAQGGGRGQCQLRATAAGGWVTVLAKSGFDAGDGVDAQFVPLIAMYYFPGYSPVEYRIECNELSGEQIYYDARVAAVGLSAK